MKNQKRFTIHTYISSFILFLRCLIFLDFQQLRKQFQSVAVDGADVIAAASKERQKALARMEARENAAKTRTKREEERVAELKRIRGERWLPCIAREMRFCKPKIVKQ